MVKSGSFTVGQGSLAGRLGSGVGKGLAEQLPKEFERERLKTGLEQLGTSESLSPFQQFAKLASIPGITPQMLQSGSELLRQKSIIDSMQTGKEQPASYKENLPNINIGLEYPSVTTKEGVQSTLNPYIPPTGPQMEQMARQLMASEPNVYRDLDSARHAVSNQVQGNVSRSNAEINKRSLEENVQAKTESELGKEIATLGAQIPGRVTSNLQQEAIEKVRLGEMTPEQAKKEVGRKAEQASKDFSNIRSWGGTGLIANNAKSLISSMKTLQKNARENGYQKEAAESLTAENGLTPEFAHALMYPVSDVKDLNNILKTMPDITSSLEKIPTSSAGLASPLISKGLKFLGRAIKDTTTPVLDAAPSLAKAMGYSGSPLAIAYELEKKGYDSQAWRDYLLENMDDLNLTTNQIDELQKSKPSFYGWLNDWWLKSFSGVK
jgi:hypothetical protein